MYYSPLKLHADVDGLETQLLAQELCSPYYKNHEPLGSSVTAAIASATPIAAAAIAGKMVMDLSSYPQCAVSL